MKGKSHANLKNDQPRCARSMGRDGRNAHRYAVCLMRLIAGGCEWRKSMRNLFAMNEKRYIYIQCNNGIFVAARLNAKNLTSSNGRQCFAFCEEVSISFCFGTDRGRW